MISLTYHQMETPLAVRHSMLSSIIFAPSSTISTIKVRKQGIMKAYYKQCVIGKTRYISIHCRMQLAILHFNENCARRQKETRVGAQRYSVKYPKYKDGAFTVTRVLEDATYSMYCLLRI